MSREKCLHQLQVLIMLYHFSQRKAFVTPSRVIIRHSAKVSQSEPCSPFLSYSEYEWVQLTFIVQVDFWGIRGGRWGRKKWWGGATGRTNIFSTGCCINRSTETKWIRLFLIPLASENMGESEWEPIYHGRREWDVQIDRKSITEAEVHHGIICDDPRPRQVDKMQKYETLLTAMISILKHLSCN